MAKQLDPNQIAADWANGLAAKTDKISRGIDSVTVAPGAAAARQKSVWQANTAAAADKFARNVGKVGLAEWQSAAKTKGLPRIASGAQAAQPKMAAFLGRFLPFIASAAAALPPRGSYEQNKARMIAMVDKAHQFANQ